MANVLPRSKQLAALNAIVEGSSVRSTERMTGVHRDTILRLMVRVGNGCSALLDEMMVNLPCTRLELDEGALALTPSSMGPTADPRASFVLRLRTRLRLLGAPVQLISAELGSNAVQTMWILALQMPNQHVVTVHAPLKPTDNPVSDATCEDVAMRLLMWSNPQPAPR